MSQSDPSATPQVEEETSANTYHLACNDCLFETTVTGDIYHALDVADEHKEEHGKFDTDHFVDIQMER